MTKKNVLLILFGFIFSNAQSQLIKTVSFTKEKSLYKLVYNLPQIADNYDVILTSNYPTGRIFAKVTENALGDIGENISSGNDKVIYWQPKKEADFNDAILEFKIVIIPLATTNEKAEVIVLEVPNENNSMTETAAKTELEQKQTEVEEETKTDIEIQTEVENKPELIVPEIGISKGISGAGAEVKGRTVRSKPDVPTNRGVNGIVIVKICIDTRGNVVRAQFIEEGSTVTDDRTIGAAVTNAKNWKFNENSMAADRACGVIKFYYKMK